MDLAVSGWRSRRKRCKSDTPLALRQRQKCFVFRRLCSVSIGILSQIYYKNVTYRMVQDEEVD